jgi:hypothetical protein
MFHPRARATLFHNVGTTPGSRPEGSRIMRHHVQRFYQDFSNWHSDVRGQVILGKIPSLERPEVQRARQKAYRQLAHLAVSAIHRNLVEHGMPRNGSDDAVERFVKSKCIASAQERMGINVPLHEELETMLTHIIQVIDDSSANISSDLIVAAKEEIHEWFDTFVRKPYRMTLASLPGNRRQTY